MNSAALKSRKASFGLCLTVALLLSSCAHLLDGGRSLDKAKIHLQAAVERFNNRDYNLAVESTLKAIELAPDFPEAYNHLAVIYMETKRYAKAQEAFQKALEIQPDYPEVFNNIGVLLNRQERFADAVPYFERALKDPRYPTPENALTNMGYSQYRLGQLTSAKANHQKALDISPNFCLAAKNLGDVYVKERRYHQAARYFRKSIRNCPLYQESRYKLGLVLVKLGRKKLARTELERLVKQHEEGPYVERSNEVLKYLR